MGFGFELTALQTVLANMFAVLGIARFSMPRVFVRLSFASPDPACNPCNVPSTPVKDMEQHNLPNVSNVTL